MEFCSGGSLAQFAKRFPNRRIPESAVRAYTRQILLGLEYLHGQSVIHRDIKPANVLMCQEAGRTIVKLAGRFSFPFHVTSLFTLCVAQRFRMFQGV